MLSGCGGLAPVEQAAEKAAVVAGADSDWTASIRLRGQPDYGLFDLGSAAAGDEWSVLAEGDGAWRVVLALFDEQDNLLWRERLPLGQRMVCTVRRPTARLQLGVMATSEEPVECVLTAGVRHGQAVPEPRPQLVWLDFGPASGVHVNRDRSSSIDAFAAEDIGRQYAGQTDVLRSKIVETIRGLYAEYAVEILSSDEDPAPTEPHATIYFGGESGRFLGLSDGVDQANLRCDDAAIVYVDAFALYDVMALSAAELGRMIGNTAAHELGHLLGLCHTRGAQQLMDDSRGAWDLAGESLLGRAPLAETVFPFGMQDADAVLSANVGRRVELAIRE